MPIHLRAEPGDYAAAVLCPGDPRRAAYIAATFFDPGWRQVNEERGMLGFTGTFDGRPISVQSTGMGCPSAGIVFEELIQLGATRLDPRRHVRRPAGSRPAPRRHRHRAVGDVRGRDAAALRRRHRLRGDGHVRAGRAGRAQLGRECRHDGPRRPGRHERHLLRPRPDQRAAVGAPRPPRPRDGGRHALHRRRRQADRGAGDDDGQRHPRRRPRTSANGSPTSSCAKASTT